MPTMEFRGHNGARGQQKAQVEQEAPVQQKSPAQQKAQLSGASKPYAHKRSARIALSVALSLCMGAVLWLYAHYDPATSHLAPKCPFHLITGYDCPACGNQRSLHALLSGDLVGALRFNPFLYLSLPYIGAIIYATTSRSPRARRWYRVVCSPLALYTYVALLIIWWIVRNTPLWPY